MRCKFFFFLNIYLGTWEAALCFCSVSLFSDLDFQSTASTAEKTRKNICLEQKQTPGIFAACKDATQQYTPKRSEFVFTMYFPQSNHTKKTM